MTIQEILTEEYKTALQIESKFDKFQALGEFIKDTSSSNMPDFLKKRFIQRAEEHQFELVGFL